jgi:exopolysaccharide production protein ExoQ
MVVLDDSQALSKRRSWTVTGRTAPSVSLVELIVWAGVIFVLLNPFVFIVTNSDPTIPTIRYPVTLRRAGEGSQLPIYFMRAAIVFALLVATFHAWSIAALTLKRIAFLALFIIWAFTSLLWTDSKETSLNFSVALLLLCSAAYLLSIRLNVLDLARAFLYSSVIMVGLSLIVVVIAPRYGIHQVADAQQNVHAGAWRGVFTHKNQLGQVCAIYISALLFAGRHVVKPVFRLGMIVVLLALLGTTRSASPIVISFLTPILVLATVYIGGWLRVVTMVAIGVVGYIGLILLEILLTFLGRDTTFTGRTYLWNAALESISLRPFFGYGYSSPTYGDYTYFISRLMGVYDPHNGVLDTWLGLGAVGVVLLVCAVAAAIQAASQLNKLEAPSRQASAVMAAVVWAWFIAIQSESGVRPFTPMAGLGFVALCLARYRPITVSRWRG